MTLTIARAAWATSTTAAMSAWTSASRPALSAPIWMTMSSSVAPSPIARTGLEHLRLGPVVAMREADRRPDRDIGAVEDRAGAHHVRRSDTDRRDVVLGRQPAAVLDERVVELGAQQRVIDGLGDVAVGQLLDGRSHVAHLM